MRENGLKICKPLSSKEWGKVISNPSNQNVIRRKQMLL